MTTASNTAARGGLSAGAKRGIGIAVVAIVLIAMGLDTAYVPKGTAVGASSDAFSPQEYGQSEFPKVKQKISQRAAPAAMLATALSKDKDAAADKYGVPGTIGPVLSVKFSGTVDSCESGICTVKVPDVPADQTIRVQVGPAVNGTALRDGAGGIAFGDFKNQIEYQNAASAINDAMKSQVLSGLDRDTLKGKHIDVVGAFQLIIDNNWLITPVTLSVSS